MCGCSKKSSAGAQSYTVTSPDGTQKSYRSKAEAEAQALRKGGTVRRVG